MLSFEDRNWHMIEIDGKVIVQNKHRDRKTTIPYVYKNSTLCEVYDKYKEMGLL